MLPNSMSTPQSDLPSDSYVVLGLATCYLRQDGEITEIQIIEPLPSAYLETVLQGTATAYSALYSTTFSAALANPAAWLPSEQQKTTFPCEDFTERLAASARSYINRPSATHLIPKDQVFTTLNFSLDQKRILNPKNKVSKSDNIKQHQYTHEVL